MQGFSYFSKIALVFIWFLLDIGQNNNVGLQRFSQIDILIRI